MRQTLFFWVIGVLALFGIDELSINVECLKVDECELKCNPSGNKTITVGVNKKVFIYVLVMLHNARLYHRSLVYGALGCTDTI